MLAIPGLSAAQQADNPLLHTLQATFGAAGITPVLAVVGLSVFACGLASMAATSRLLYAMARDRMLPGSCWLALVPEGHCTPRNAILFIWSVSSGVVLGLPTLDIIARISAVAGYLGYVWINGHNLGRYWNIGPQQRLYWPAPWLRRGMNEILVLDLLQTEPKPIAGKETLTD